MRGTEDTQELVVRGCVPDDFDALARMNLELIEDEGHRNPMNVRQLRERFERFVNKDGWSVDLFLIGTDIAGFATYRYERDDSDPNGRHVHLRQFYIARDRRRSGLGANALELLMESRFSVGDRVVLDVLEKNPGGKLFWLRTGFAPYAAIMEKIVVGRKS